MISQSLLQTFIRGQGILDGLRLSSLKGVLARFLLRATCALLSAGLLTCSLPSPDLGWLAWIALVPLLIACAGLSPLQAGTVGFLSGMAANLAIYHWVFAVNGFGIHHFIVLSTFFALFPAAWCAGLSWLNRRQTSLIFAAAALWVLLDYVRAHAGFMAFPWGTLAQTQHQNLALLQLATITGEYGVTFLVVMINVAIFGFVFYGAWRTAVPVVVLVALIHLLGALALFFEPPGPTVRLAAVQPHILLGERATAAGRAIVLDRLIRLTQGAAASNPSMIVWPETAIAGNVRTDPLLAMGLVALAQDINTPIVFGAGEVEKFASRDPRGNLQRRAYNSAYVVTPEEGLRTPYLKRVLMPFGEYVPLEHVIGWPAWLAPPTFQKVAGDQGVSFRLPNGLVVSPLICWENVFAWLARESVRNGAHLLVLLTNDGWFGPTAEPVQHNLASVFRAIENRVPIVISSNSGPSMIIDAYGRVIVQAATIFHEDVITGDVSVGSGGTLYMRIGDVFVFIVVGGLAFVALGCWLNHRGTLSDEATVV
jgi:apolipoprotein N-acyltransferase